MLARLNRPSGLPEIPEGEAYMLAAFDECGVIKPGAMGTLPLDWVDLHSYAQGSLALSPGPDLVTLHQMCQRYWSELQAGQDSLVIAPADRLPQAKGSTAHDCQDT